jgi:hypothetical protein
MPFIYVPAGKLPDEPSQSFWMSAGEITCAMYHNLLPDSGLKLAGSRLPVTSLTWNDRLEYCRQLTRYAQARGILPDGYIFRLPYADEWNFVLRGAWQSAANFIHEQQSLDSYAWHGGNSMYQLHDTGSKAAGLMGFTDMIGNASESVLMRPTPSGQAPQIGDFGASFRNRRVSSEINRNSQIDLLENNWSGFRVVLGHGDMEYFERNWYTGHTSKIEHANRHYEILGSPNCRWDGISAQNWLRLLGAKALILPNLELRNFLYNANDRIRELPTLLGASYQNNQWLWQDGSPVCDGEWLGNEQTPGSTSMSKYLVWDHGFWRGISPEATVPQLIAEYPLQRKHQVRPSLLPKMVLRSP